MATTNNNLPSPIKGEILSPLMNDQIMLRTHNAQNQQPMIIGNLPNNATRCLQTTQGCVIIQSNAVEPQVRKFLMSQELCSVKFPRNNSGPSTTVHSSRSVRTQKPQG